MTFIVEGKEFESIQDYRRQAIEKFKKESELNLAPEVFSGFKAGSPIDFHAHEAVGLKHPKKEKYYRKENMDSDFKSIMEGIEVAGSLRDPVIAYILDGEIYVLDGATRLTSISYIKETNPTKFARIKVRVFKGTLQEAQFEMVRRNMPDGIRTLTSLELCEAIERFSRSGCKPKEICTNLHKPLTWEPIVYKYLKTREMLLPELYALMGTSNFSVTAAFECLKVPLNDQRNILKSLLAGEVVLIRDVKKLQVEEKKAEETKKTETPKEESKSESEDKTPPSNSSSTGSLPETKKETKKAKINVAKFLEDLRMAIFATESVMVQEGYDLEDLDSEAVKLFMAMRTAICDLDVQMQKDEEQKRKAEERRLASVGAKNVLAPSNHKRD